MNAKSTWSLVAVAAMVFALIFFVERPYRASLNQVVNTRVMPDLITTNITSIQVNPVGQMPFKVDRTNNDWQVTQPISYAGENAKIAGFLHKLANLDWQGHITSAELRGRPDAQQEFGFDAPQFSITLEQNGDRHRLLIGKKAPAGDQLFLQVLGDDGFYVVDGELLNFIPKTVSDWRSHSLARWNETGFNTLRAHSGANSFEAQFAVSNRLWRLVKPLPARADNTKIYTLLQKTLLLQISSFVSDDASVDLDKFGLQTPDLEFVFASGTNDLIDILVGQSPTNNPAQVYAKRRDQDTIFLIPKEPLAGWRVSASELRDPHLANLPEKLVDRIEVEAEDQFTVEKTNETWTVRGPQTFIADADLVQELLTRLNITEVDVEKNAVTDFASYGLDHPLLRYTLKVTRPITNDVRADLFTHVDFGKNDGKFFAHRSDESSVYNIKPDDFLFLPQASWQMRDRRIWSYDSTNVVNVLVKQKGRTCQYIRNGKGEWIVAPGSQGMINPFAFEEAVHRLGDLRAVFWSARGEQNFEAYGFKDADYSISLQVKRDGKLETLELQFGGLSAFQNPFAAVTVNGEKLIFEFPAMLYFGYVGREISIHLPPSIGAR